MAEDRTSLVDYVRVHTYRGECRCGQCIDRGDRPDPRHGIDMVFFIVAPSTETADIDEFRRLSQGHRGDYGDVDPFDGAEHNYLELGAWLGDQGLAMQYMALGKMLGVFNLLSPALLGIEGDMALEMAGMGLLAVQASKR